MITLLVINLYIALLDFHKGNLEYFYSTFNVHVTLVAVRYYHDINERQFIQPSSLVKLYTDILNFTEH